MKAKIKRIASVLLIMILTINMIPLVKASAATQNGILLFNYDGNGNYTTTLKTELAVKYKPNGTGTTRTAYIKNLGWHHARYNNVAYPDDPLYCIEPYRDFAASMGGNSVDRDLSVNGSGNTTGSNVWFALPEARREAIAQILLYSNHLWDHSISVTTTAKDSNPNVPLRIATQFLIYEIVCGLRNPVTFVRNDVNECGTDGAVFYNAGVAAVSDFSFYYDSLVQEIQAASIIPSFTGGTPETAPTITLESSTTSVIDTNGVLEQWNFENGDGAGFSKAGNTLAITQIGEIGESTVFRTIKTNLSPSSSTFNIWYMTNSTFQTTISLATAKISDIYAYFKLKAPAAASLAIQKNTDDGINLEGWEFHIYADAECTQLVSGPHITDSSGNIEITDLTPGTVYVKEIGHTDSSISAKYKCESENPQAVSLVAGEIATVSFHNKLATGNLSLAKTTSDGKNLEGWQFSLYSDAACTKLISGPHITDSTGALNVSSLTVGTVYVKEIGHTDPTIAALYTCDSTNPQKVTITSGGTATVSFHNKLNTGSVLLKKETSTGENLSGWQIGLYTDVACSKAVSGSPFTTGEDGTVTVPDLAGGTVYAKEIPTDDPYWVCDSAVKTITVEPGKTAEVTFTNSHYGDIRITKIAVNGSAEGWSFQILDAEKNPIATIKTGADGYACSDLLLPGQYFIREVHDREDTYWEYDAVVEKEVIVTAGSQAEVSYTNTQYGKLQIQKSMDGEGSLDGWQFCITDASGKKIEGSPFTSNASGLILTGKLLPGNYVVEELIPENSLYYCTSENPQTVTVTAGETAEVTFTNAMRSGSISMKKVDSRGESLAGAKFLLEYSEDGSLWWPIEYADSLGEGKCSNPNITDGCLTTGADGVLEWNNLHPGLMYRLTELEAPKGYSLLSEPAFEGKLPMETLMLSLRVVNCEAFTLPQTGSAGAMLFRISQLLCIALCSALLLYSYRKERR